MLRQRIPPAPGVSGVLSTPQLPPYRWFASTDSDGKNEDYVLLKPGETRRVPLSAGKLIRLWSTASQPEKVVLSLSNGITTTLMSDNRAPVGELYEKAFTLYPTSSTSAAVRDLKSSAALVVTNRDTQPNKWFYQATVRARSDNPTEFGGVTGEEQPEQNIAPQKEVPLFSSTRSGVLAHLTLEVDTVSPEVLRNLKLRATWDEGGQPAVDVPLLALTGQFFGARSVLSDGWNFGVRSDSALLQLKFPMPFSSGARVTLFNGGSAPVKVKATAGLDVSRTNKPLPPYRFCAQYGSARTQTGQPVQMLRVLGSGAFVGLNLGIAPAPESPRRAFAYLEGNETITADGRVYEGTGAEDFFNSAWYYPEKPFARPYHGMTFKSVLPPKVSAYRLMIPDAVPFQKSLNFAFQHGSNNRGDDLEYRWVALWYQKAPFNFEVPNTLQSGVAAIDSESAATSTQGDTQPPVRWLIWMAPVALLVVFIFRALRRPKPS
jgi:hypothetical protein